MEAFVHRALADHDASRAPLLAITVPARPAPLDAFSPPAELGPIFRWDAPAPEHDGRAWSFVGFGEAARVEGDGEARFDEIQSRADALFASLIERRHPEAGFAPSPRLCGGVAFRPEPMRAAPWAAFRDASFVLPRWVYGTSGDRAFLCLVVRADDRASAAAVAAALASISTGAVSAADASGASSVRMEHTSPEVWGAMIDGALTAIRARRLQKVVPLALCKVVTAGAIDVGVALRRLAARYPECVRFAVQRGDALFLGASPERLVVKRGLAIETDALAGSAPRRGDDDARAAAALLASAKDRREHQMVVDAIGAALGPLTRELDAPSAPVVRTLRNVHHLWTPIHATLARPAHVIDLVRALHPTPAVCGTPRDVALRWISENEPETRGWYTGAVGWFDAAGDGAFSVAIRSGLLTQSMAWLYAGAGIVDGSDAALEYAETLLKLAPMLAALGLLA